MHPSFDWVLVPAGRALLGAASVAADAADGPSAAEAPATPVTLAGYSLARTPVTNAWFAAFVRATGHRPPAHWEGPVPPARLARHPVTYVDWHDALAFCAWAGVRLPTEAEWEHAARGPDGGRYPWGDDPPTPCVANCGGWFGGTTEVGAFPEGASPYGVLDLAGGVWEWTASLERPDPDRAGDGHGHAPAAGRRVLRGGSFQHAPADVRCTARGRLHPDARDEYIGFRVAHDGPAPPEQGMVDWVAIPGGELMVGTADDSAPAVSSDGRPGLGAPRLPVSVAGFQIARTPVTNAQYAAYIAATATRPPGHWEATKPPPALLDHPVTHVDWHEATAFCAWAGVRLPTEAEWEKAAAGPDGRRYPWGDEEPGPRRAVFGVAEGAAATRPVTERPLGASPYGALDMAGNVWEWTSSLHRPYPYDPDDGREDRAALGPRVLRGGSFRSPDAVYLRCAFRSRSHATRRRDHIGFRVARDLSADCW